MNPDQTGIPDAPEDNAPLPPVLDYAFLSDADSGEVYIVQRDGMVRHWEEGVAAPLLTRRREQTDLPLLLQIPDAEKLPWCWRQGWLPILEIGADCALFARGDRLFCRTGNRCCCFPTGETVSPDYWEAAARETERYWIGYLASGRQPDTGSELLNNAWKMSLTHTRCSFVGRHPKYGVEKYGEFRADGFPPAVVSLCGVLLDFGHAGEARELLSFYLNRFVRADGTIDYYGTSLSEYGMLLELAARLTKNGGEEWCRTVLPELRAMVRFLADRLNPWITAPASEYGLPCGAPEADRRHDTGEYFHNAAWIWRGLTEFERAEAPLSREEHFELKQVAGVLRRRLDRAWRERRSALNGFPPYAVAQQCAIADCAESVEAAYANYRYYPEMLASGAFSPEDMRAMIAVREQRHGEIAGMTRLSWPKYPWELADHWPVASYARGLLELGDRERFMRLLKNHVANYISPDLFYAYESVTTRTVPRHAYSDWCGAAQLALPQMIAWSFRYDAYRGECISWNGPDPAVAAALEESIRRARAR